MNKKHRIAEFKNMYLSVTDPEEVQKAKRKAEREARFEEKVSDTGL